MKSWMISSRTSILITLETPDFPRSQAAQAVNVDKKEFDMTKAHLFWSHGLEAAPWGEKSKTMAEVAKQADLTLEALDYRDTKDPEQRAARLLSHLGEPEAPIILAGSSMGAYVSLSVAGEIPVAGLFLVAPALYLPGYKKHLFFNLPKNVEVIHGWHDDVVPVDNSIRFARLHKTNLHILPADHRMTGQAALIGQLFARFLENIIP